MNYNEFVRAGRDDRARRGQEDVTGLCFVSPPYRYYYIYLYAHYFSSPDAMEIKKSKTKPK